MVLVSMGGKNETDYKVYMQFVMLKFCHALLPTGQTNMHYTSICMHAYMDHKERESAQKWQSKEKFLI